MEGAGGGSNMQFLWRLERNTAEHGVIPGQEHPLRFKLGGRRGWSHRASADSHTQKHSRGIRMERMIQLAALMGPRVWVSSRMGHTGGRHD